MEPVELYNRVYQWLFQNGLDFIQSLLEFVIILIVGKIAISIICRVTYRILHQADRVSDILEKFTVDILGKVLWVLVLLVGISSFGVNVVPIITGLGVGGFILGFAFQETLGNLAAGLMLLLNAPFKVGDFIEAAGTGGVVQEMNLMATTLTTPDNKKILIPNNNIWGGNIVNYSAMDTRRVDMTVGISYTADIGKAIGVIRDVIKNNEHALKDPECVVEVVEMGDSSVNLVVRSWCNTADYWTVFFSLQRNIKESLDANNIEIPFPQMDVHHHGLPQQS
jgi:small conductance mechanosensitive channel